MRYFVFDIDGVLCTTDENPGYENHQPHLGRIAKVNALYDTGHHITLFTARGSHSGIDWKELTVGQLSRWGVRYHRLLMGKPHADVVIDDKAVPLRDFFEEGTATFSFVGNSVNPQTPEQTLLVLTYELGKVIEYNYKARVYGVVGYYCDANQRKEMADLISMARMYCQQKGWDFEELMRLGEEAYLERMEDIRKYGKSAPSCVGGFR